MSTKVKVRRHSFSSLEEAVKEVGKEAPSSNRTVTATVVIPQSERKRKSQCEPSLATPEQKRTAPPASLAHLVESMQEIPKKKDQKHKTADDFLCCLPGGRLPFRYTSLHKS